MRYHLEREQHLPRPIEDVFAFFEDAHNLEQLTPPQLRFRVTTPPPIVMRAGTLIDYRLTLFGVPFDWRTLIESYRPPEHFVDVQLRGPYRLWRHLHSFEAIPGGTLMRDRVEYELPFGVLGQVARALFVRRQVEAIFDFRRDAIARAFEP